MQELNEWTGVSDKTLAKRHARLCSVWRRLSSSEEGGGVALCEGVQEEIEAIEREMFLRRTKASGGENNGK